MADVLLWHFPVSHFNEKVRWALDLKRIPHRRRALGPDYLFRAWWATGRATLPILFIDGRAIGDSTRIIAALEEMTPTPPVYPRGEAARRRALALEDWLDEELGPAVRSAIVGTIFASDDPGAGIDVLTTGMPPSAARMIRPALPLFQRFYFYRHRIDATRIESYRKTVLDALDRLERERGGRDYLVDDEFSVADLTAAAMLCPLVEPAEWQYRPSQPTPPVLAPFFQAVLDHPAGTWTAEMYRRHRGTSAEVGATPATGELPNV
jgi:glutathione S-transferase